MRSERPGKLRLRYTQKTKLSTKQVGLIASSVAFALVFGFTIFLNFTQSTEAYAAATGDYRSNGNGNWSTAATWQRYNGSGWVTASTAPASGDGVITIQSGHTVTVTATATVDQVVVNSGGTLVLNSGITMNIANGTGTDLDVTGIFKNAGTVTPAASAVTVYQNGGKYQHNYTSTAGVIPTATWNTGSTCEIIGYTNNNAVPTGFQSFSNFTWNCSSQSSDINLNGALTTVNGTFTCAATGSKELRLANNAYTMSPGADFVVSGGNLEMTTNNNSNATLNIAGNYSQTGGTFNMVDGNNSVATINASGNWSHTGGTLTCGGNSASIVSVIFKKTGRQTFTATGNTVGAKVEYTVNSGSILDIATTSIVKGGDFTASAGSTIEISNAAGITSSGSTGSIQTSSRGFTAGANYTYDGSVAQVTGSGLPSTVNGLTINNSNGLTLSSTTSVSGTLTLTSGKITTGGLVILPNELKVTNTAASAITGHSSSSYVVGLLRRNVSGTGTYDFPVGSSSNYELASVTLTGATGFTSIVGSFTASNPITSLLPLVGIIVSGLGIDKMLDAGYWTLTPNAAMSGGTYSVSMKEKGYAAPQNGRSYSLLKRTGVLGSWQSLGTHAANTQTEIAGVVTAVRSGLTSFSDFAIGYGEYLAFKDPLLISGTDGQPNAIYKFADISTGVDAWVKIVSLNGGATLDDIDHYSAGYDEAWQPYINAPKKDTSYITWQITFKVAGTSEDTTLAYMPISAIDVDGDGAALKEFVEATGIYSYSLGPSGSDLTVSNVNNGSYRAVSTITNVADIDTARPRAIYQINYRDVTSFMYKTGAISTSNSNQVRQTSLYFKYFFNGNNALPIKLATFNVKLNSEKKVDIKWVTAEEKNNDFFTIERSVDGQIFEKVLTKKGAGNSAQMLTYTAIDASPRIGISYYRLKQTDFDGKFTYSDVRSINNSNGNVSSQSAENSSLKIQSVAPSIFHESFKVNFTSEEDGEAELIVTGISGQQISQEKIPMQQGSNSYQYFDQKNMTKGIYFVILVYNDQRVSRKIVKE